MRYSRDDSGQGCCPYCDAMGMITPTEDPMDRTHERFASIDDGCTEPLMGILCEDCYLVLVSPYTTPKVETRK